MVIGPGPAGLKFWKQPAEQTGVQANAWSTADSVNLVFSNNDKTVAIDNIFAAGVRSTTRHQLGTAGKYYAELLLVNVLANQPQVGIKAEQATGLSPANTNTANIYVVMSNGNILNNAALIGNVGGACVSGDVLCIAWDSGAERIWFRRNSGLWNNDAAADPAAGINGLDISAQPNVNFGLWMAAASAGRSVTIRTEAAELALSYPIGFTSWMGEAIFTSAVGVAAGTSDAIAVGETVTDTTGGAVGVGDAVAVGDVGGITAAGDGVAAGAGTAEAPGIALALADGTAAGTGLATASGLAVSAGAGTATGTGSAVAGGATLGIGVGAAPGVGAATATADVGVVVAGVGTAVGSSVRGGTFTGRLAVTAGALGAIQVQENYVGTSALASGLTFSSGLAPTEAVAVGAATAAAAGVATAVGTSAAVAASFGIGTGAATGIGAATATGSLVAATSGTGTGLGSANGVALPLGLGVGAASGIGAATAAAMPVASGVGSAAGFGTTNAVPQATVVGIGSATGLGIAVAIANSDAAGAGTAVGGGSALALSDLGATTGTAAGLGTAQADVVALASAVGTAEGLGAATGDAGVGAVVAAATGTAAGTGSADAVSADAGIIPEPALPPVHFGGLGGPRLGTMAGLASGAELVIRFELEPGRCSASRKRAAAAVAQGARLDLAIPRSATVLGDNLQARLTLDAGAAFGVIDWRKYNEELLLLVA